MTRVAQQLPPTDRQSTTQLFRRIVNGVNGLVDRHVQLVKQEIKEDILHELRAGKTLGIGIGVGVVAGLVLFNVLIMMIVLGLNELGSWFIPYVGKFLGWIVILILIGVAFFLTYKLVMRAIREAKITPLDDTRAAVREDITWVQQLLTRNGR
jgi:predicted PurR-regulated permease PerM